MWVLIGVLLFTIVEKIFSGYANADENNPRKFILFLQQLFILIAISFSAKQNQSASRLHIACCGEMEEYCLMDRQ
jgi:hypothetical protein